MQRGGSFECVFKSVGEHAVETGNLEPVSCPVAEVESVSETVSEPAKPGNIAFLEAPGVPRTCLRYELFNTVRLHQLIHLLLDVSAPPGGSCAVLPESWDKTDSTVFALLAGW